MRTKFLVLALALAPVALSAQSLDFGSAPAGPEFTLGGGDVTAPGIGGSGGGMGDITGVRLEVTPEPSTYVLLASGLLGVFGVARRRKLK